MRVEDLKDKLIVISSNEPWDGMKFLKHHYATEFAKYAKVIFIDPAVEYSPSKVFSSGIQIKKVEDNIDLLTYTNQIPSVALDHFMFHLNDYLNTLKLRQFFKSNYSDKEIIFWQFDPFRWVNISKHINLHKIYHVCDPYNHFPTDKLIAADAEIIVCTSDNFLEDYKAFNKPLLHIPHGVLPKDLKTDQDATYEIKTQYGEFMILAGTINDTVDIQLANDLMDNLPNETLLICGMIEINDSKHQELYNSLLEKDNVHYIGVLSPKELGNFVSASKLCLAIYSQERVNNLPNKRQSLLKFTSYLAQFKPILATQRSEMDHLQGNSIYYADSRAEFIELAKRLFVKR